MGISCLLIALACLAAIIPTLFWTLHWRPAGGLLLSLKEGALRIAWWDQGLVRFDYRFGIQAEPADQRWRIRWLPFLYREKLSTWLGGPLWIPALIALGCAARPWHTRARRGHCPRCGYNFKGLPRGAPCPECGPAGAP
jgi:hypothetical protein